MKKCKLVLVLLGMGCLSAHAAPGEIHECFAKVYFKAGANDATQKILQHMRKSSSYFKVHSVNDQTGLNAGNGLVAILSCLTEDLSVAKSSIGASNIKNQIGSADLSSDTVNSVSFLGCRTEHLDIR